MNNAEINELLLAPTERLSMELKAWLDLGVEDDRAKIAKALMALRNHGGGVLVVGFDNKTLKPIAAGRPPDLATSYHQDTIQKLVKDFIDPPFEVAVRIGEKDGLKYPVLEVPSGIIFPVFARRQASGVRQYAVYIRSVNNSGVVESTEPRSPEDWDALFRVCFENREADIARFFRRHLPEISRQIAKLPELADPIEAIFKSGTAAYIDSAERWK